MAQMFRYSSNGTAAQKFVVKKASDHEYLITSEKIWGKVLDVAGGYSVQVQMCGNIVRTTQMLRDGDL